MSVGVILTMIFYKDPVSVEKFEREVAGKIKKDDKALPVSTAASTLIPLKGKVVALSELKDRAFSSGALGEGIAIVPEENILYLPADGEITALFPTGHAIGLITVSQIQLLDGKGFISKVKIGDEVKQGQKILIFDRKFIEKVGYEIVTPIIITNSNLLDNFNLKKTDCKDIKRV